MTDPRPVQRAGQPSQEEPEMKSLLQAWQMYNSKKEDDEPEDKPVAEAPPPEKEKLIPPPKQAGPEDPEIMEALLDAFEDNVNLGDKRSARRWLERKNYPKVAEWIEKLKQDAYYEAMAGFFENLAKLRKRSPKLLSGIEEQTEVPADKKLDMPDNEPQAQEPAAEPPAEEPPADEPISDEPEAKPQLFDIHSAVMDMYLEGIDITRRSQLIDALDKGGHEAEVETVSSLSLSEFYTFLSDFFKKMAGSLGSEGPDTSIDEPSADEVPADKALEVPPEEEPAPQQESEGFMLEREMKLDLEAQAIAAPEELANEILNAISQNTGDEEVAKKDVNVLLAQIARGRKITRDMLNSVAYKSETPEELVSALLNILVKHDVPVDTRTSADESPSEAHGLGIPLPYSRRSMKRSLGKSIRRENMFTEAPEELLPGEVREAKRMTLACVEGGIPLAEAAERVAKKVGTEKHMPEKLIKSLEKYLGSLKNAKNEEGEPVDEPKDDKPAEKKPEAPAAEKDEEGDDEEEGKKDKEAPKEEPPVITGDQAVPQAAAPVAPAAPVVSLPTAPAVPAAPVEVPAEEPTEKDGEDADGEEADEEEVPAEKSDEPKDEKPEGKKDEEEDEEEEDDEEEEGKKDEENDALGELLRLALAPSGKQWGSGTVTERKVPKFIAILKEETTGAGVGGARDTGVLDVFSFGGYLERALPYLISASMSRFEEGDKAKFVNLYRKFTETNDITEMTKLAGALADVVEWGDATQEGAELVKNLRFMSDFMNVLRGSVDYSKKAFPAI
jgi:hypothetical protein